MSSEFRQLVERVKLRSPIEAVVGDRVGGLKKQGALYWARCPFHEERTPSFAVDPRKGTWRCYGACGEGGDVLSFVERYDGLDFLDALRLLASQAGEEIPRGILSSRDRRGGDEAKKERRLEVLRRAAGLYRRWLREEGGSRARGYLESRGIAAKTAERFGLGWAPESGNPLHRALTAGGDGGEKVDEGTLVELGLVGRGESGRPYDFFRGRLVIPIGDLLGRPVGFGGRILGTGDGAGDGAPAPGRRPVPKYVNTPETPLFHKGRLIYGLHLAGEAVRRSHHLVLVEGYTDVMAAHQAGIRNAAAILGTSTTDEHAQLVRRSGARRVTLVFDGDEAGRKATLRALAGLMPIGARLDVVSLDGGQDPCDLLEGTRAPELSARIEDAREWFAWSIDGLRGLGGEDLAAGVRSMLELVGAISSPVERDVRLVEASRALGLSLSSLRREASARRGRSPGSPRSFDRAADRAGSQAPRGNAGRAGASRGARRSGVDGAYRQLVGALLRDNGLIPLYAPWAEGCPEGDLQRIFAAVLDLHAHSDAAARIDAGSVMTHLGDDPARDLVADLDEEAGRAESPSALASAQVAWLQRCRRERELAQVRASLSDGLPADGGSEELLRDLHTRLRKDRVPTAAAASSYEPPPSRPVPGPGDS